MLFLNEIFPSIQGEGSHIGERQLFIRFSQCNLRCKYCDTKESWTPGKYVTIYYPQQKVESPNPIEVKDVVETIKNFPGTFRRISLTGGEPLLQVESMQKLLKELGKGTFSFFLETNGTLPDALKAIIDYIDVVSMDVKLPSSTGAPSFWEIHKKVLEVVFDSHVEFFAKVVVTEDTTFEDIDIGGRLLSEFDPHTLLVIQPSIASKPLISKTLAYQEKILPLLPETRVIPQLHKLLGLK